MLRRGDGLDRSADVELLDRLVQVVDGRVGEVISTADLNSLEGLVGLVDGRDWARKHVSDELRRGTARDRERTSQDGEGRLVTVVAENDARSRGELEVTDLGGGDVEGDGNGEENAVGEAEVGHDAASKAPSAQALSPLPPKRQNSRLVILLAHEALERGEASVEDELEVAELAVGETDLGSEVVGLGEELLVNGSVAKVKILEDSAVRSVGHLGCKSGGGGVKGGLGGVEVDATRATF